MNPQYLQLAYERAIITYLRRHLEDRYLGVGGGLREELVCESVPYEARLVTPETFADMVQRLSEEEVRLTTEMATYEFRKRDVSAFASPSKKSSKGTGAGTRGKGRKPRAGNSSSS